MKEKSDEVRIEFKGLTREQLDHLFKAEKELHEAGVSFDTGYDFENNRRDWEFDWSLKGATVRIKNVRVEEKK